ncbi:hypothetical protein [Salibaculum griseiflavum]|uniref:Uncharacterized protein n=1 Tax=Salibaculum griseiflavum TaxID=1914409 RepID=A0A2V1P0S2_9RHOB|nr:hypothetical protein [Salibaculum griseiflavum]PWG16153.1 hypothetical protein DFK10_13250 [Salibaculum griseiflavum]
MKVSMQMLRDLGVCDGANAYIGAWFAANDVEVIEYAVALQTLLDHQEAGQSWIDANYAGTAHSDYAGWVTWMRALATRPDAITYFGDHILEDLFRTGDGQLHETLAAACAHDQSRFAALRRDHAAARVINGVRFGEGGSETWEVVDPARDDLAGFDAFVWHDSATGLNHRTQSATEAIAFDAAQAKTLDAIDAAQRAAPIEQRITDESGAFRVWVAVGKGG